MMTDQLRLTPVHKTKILPLRWIGNFCGSISAPHLSKAIDLSEMGNLGWRYKYHAWIWSITSRPSKKWSTLYEWDLAWDIEHDLEMQELLQRLGSDYDENGKPYWD